MTTLLHSTLELIALLHKGLKHIKSTASGTSHVFMYNQCLLRTCFSWRSPHSLLFYHLSKCYPDYPPGSLQSFLLYKLIFRIPSNVVIFNYYPHIDNLQLKKIALYFPMSFRLWNANDRMSTFPDMSIYSQFTPPHP